MDRLIRQVLVTATGLLAMASFAWAMGAFYGSGTAGLSVTNTTAYTAFTDNQTGGTGLAFAARVVTICNTCTSRSGGACAAGSNKFVYYHLSRAATATAVSTVDLPLPPLGCDVRTYGCEIGGNGWGSIAYIADAGNVASIDVTASR